jgi:dienelactone hydrolase
MNDENFGAENNYEAVDVLLEIEERTILARILSPAPHQLAEDPLLLLHLTGPKETAFYEEPYRTTTRQFLDQGHRVVSFDLPSHGTRVDHFGDSLIGFCNAFVAGQDPFLMFIAEAKAVIDHCLAAGLVRAERIVVSGTSRAAYMALRLMAAEPRIAAAAAIAPVTDWRALSEFAAAAHRPDVAALHLSEFAAAMVGRPVFIIIGNHDTRVSTASCCQFYIALTQANAVQGHDDALINFQVLDVPGHFSPDGWHQQGDHFLLDRMTANDG